jgi:hypothetical protein
MNNKENNNKQGQERLFEEIGLIDDKFIPAREDETVITDGEIATVRVIRFLSKQNAIIAAAALLLVVGTVLMFSVFRPESPDPIAPNETTVSVTTLALVTPSEPTLPTLPTEPTEYTDPTPPSEYIPIPVELPLHTNYDDVHYCTCNVFLGFYEDRAFVLDEETGKAIREYDGGHCFTIGKWIYDPELNTFGFNVVGLGIDHFEMHPIDDFSWRFPKNTDEIKVVWQVDTAMGVIDEYLGISWSLPNEAFSKEVAVAYGGRFVSDFVYADKGLGRDVLYAVSLIDKNGKHGIVGIKGEVVLPFEYDKVLVISNNSAFVKTNEGWKIVKFGDYENTDRKRVWPQIGERSYYNAGLDSAKLAALIESGEIPFDVVALRLDSNEITDLSPLSSLTELKSLILWDNPISDLSPLSSLVNLERLLLESFHTDDNKLVNLSALSGLTKLRILGLNNSQINDVSALSGLTNLEELYLSDNQISDISALSSLTKLTSLSLYNNQVKDVSAIRSMTKMMWLGLSGNQISDLSFLDVSAMPDLIRIDISDNPISQEQLDRFGDLIPNW